MLLTFLEVLRCNNSNIIFRLAAYRDLFDEVFYFGKFKIILLNFKVLV